MSFFLKISSYSLIRLFCVQDLSPCTSSSSQLIISLWFTSCPLNFFYAEIHSMVSIDGSSECILKREVTIPVYSLASFSFLWPTLRPYFWVSCFYELFPDRFPNLLRGKPSLLVGVGISDRLELAYGFSTELAASFFYCSSFLSFLALFLSALACFFSYFSYLKNTICFIIIL